MSAFLNQINNISPLSEEANYELEKCAQTKNYKKGDLIHEQGKISKHLFFVETGLVKHFYYHNNSYYILRFFEENRFFLATDSFFNDLPASYSTQSIEETTICYIKNEDLERLCKKHHSVESFTRKLVSIVAYTAISNLKNLLYLNATERYEQFIKDFGHLQQRISLGDTAGYLGISQVSLSRIRAKK